MKEVEEMYIEDNISEGPDAEVDSLLKNVRDMGDMYFVALLLLNELEGSKYGIIPELSYLLDDQSFINILWYFEGQTIRIPTREELKEVLQMMSIYYHYNILGKVWRQALEDVGIPYDHNYYRRVWTKYNRFLKAMGDVNLPTALRRPDMDDKLKSGGDV